MKETEYCRKTVNLGRYGRRTLVYSLLSNERGGFGVSIAIPEFGETEIVEDIVPDRGTVLSLLDMLATNFVTPVSLRDVLEDWLGS